MKEFLIIIMCFFAFLGVFMIFINYTGTFWVKVFKAIYKIIEKYWLYIMLVLGFIAIFHIFLRK